LLSSCRQDKRTDSDNQRWNSCRPGSYNSILLRLLSRVRNCDRLRRHLWSRWRHLWSVVSHRPDRKPDRYAKPTHMGATMPVAVMPQCLLQRLRTERTVLSVTTWLEVSTLLHCVIVASLLSQVTGHLILVHSRTLLLASIHNHHPVLQLCAWPAACLTKPSPFLLRNAPSSTLLRCPSCICAKRPSRTHARAR